MILITGCPKSATVYISTLLQNLGLDVRHESMGMQGSADWMLAPGKESKPWVGPSFNEFTLILHQVRHPLDTISSCQKLSRRALQYIHSYLPVETNSLEETCMAIWYYWNKMAEEISSWTYKIEQLPEISNIFCKKIGYPDLMEKKYELDSVPKNINSAKPYTLLTWEKCDKINLVLSDKIKQLAKRYGYWIC